MPKTVEQICVVEEGPLETASFEHDEKPSAYSSFSAPSADPTNKRDGPTLAVETEFADCGVSEEAGSRAYNANTDQSWWRTFLRFGPLSGIFAMFLAITSIFAALGVLVGSDKAPVDHWSAPPSTYLAIFTAIANLSVRYAAMHGVVIAWWYRASKRDGATLASLHHEWLSGSSLFQAITSGRNLGLVGLACIFSTFVVTDGPLLQRASTPRQAPWINEPVPLNVSMAQELPRFWANSFAFSQKEVGAAYHWSYAFNSTVPTGTGGTASNKIYPIAGSNNMVPELGELIKNNGPLAGVIQGCPDTCTAKLHAPALAQVACTSEIIPVNYNKIPYIKDNAVINGRPAALNSDLFIISNTLVLDGPKEMYNLVTAYYTGQDCTGYLNMTACTFESAIGEYVIDIADGKATLVNAERPAIVALANNTAVAENQDDTKDNTAGGQPSTLAAIVEIAWERYETIKSVFRESTGQLTTYSNGQGLISAREFQLPNWDDCPEYSDPRPYVVKNLNTMMVWAGLVSASQNASYKAYLESKMDPGLPMSTQVTGYRTGTHPVFHTEYVYFAAAAIVELLCIALIAPTYWGWWRLGRDVSFSPLEIAKAFRSPILADFNSNSRARNIASAGRETRLRYGVVGFEAGRRMSELAFASPASVSGIDRETRLAR